MCLLYVSIVRTNLNAMYVILNQMGIWFIEIALVWEVGICVCMCVCLTQRLSVTGDVIWILYDWLNT